ncbi:MAG TPA: prolyl oligopeptidase family serine peptidase [Steroidobacteraceae bacterium]|nr:prolyl oligopeptidase family serine peptidase [Steroidobacteraceae bacterium]
MRELIAVALGAISLLGIVECADASYPPARRGDQVDDYHGEKVVDPYRWLEEPDSAESRAWIEAENRLTSGYLEKIPQRAAIKERLTQLWDYERFGLPVKRGNRYFYTRNDGLQNQAVLYVADSLDAQPRVLLDPNTLRADGTAALVIWHPSEDGKLLAYSVAEAGSDWERWSIRDVATGKDRDDKLRWVKWGAAVWSKDGSGLYYGRYDEPKSSEQYRDVNYFHKIYFHRLGDAQEKDRLIHQAGVKEWTFNPIVTQDGRYLILWTWRGADGTNQISYRDLQRPDAPAVELISGFDARYMFVGNEGGRFWFLTDADAPRGRLIEVDVAAPERSKWKTVIAEAPETLQRVSLVGDRFIASYLKDAASRVRSFDLSGGSPREIDAPALSSLGGFEGLRGDDETFYLRTDFTHPGSIYRYDIRKGESTLFRQPKLKFDPDAFETKQVFVASKDGTRVPMFVTHRRGLKLDGSNPTLVSGYGGFKISLTPGYSPEILAFLEMGGIYAQPGLRGGDEYGQAWHEAGMLGKKQNVFDDFIASAQWLIANGYTRSDKLAIRGGSNGGLLVGAVMTQRPDLFGAVLCEVGVLDMLRFHRFTIGWAWQAEYGSVDKPDDFRFLRAYSPLHNVKPGTKYPPTLITTGDHDDRVAPAHSFKFAAALQHAQAGDAPILIRIETRGGHGQGLPTTKHIDLAADSLAFFHKTLGMQAQPAQLQPGERQIIRLGELKQGDFVTGSVDQRSVQVRASLLGPDDEEIRTWGSVMARGKYDFAFVAGQPGPYRLAVFTLGNQPGEYAIALNDSVDARATAEKRETQPASPLLQKLVAAATSPLVETLDGQNFLVTFVWRGAPDTQQVQLVWALSPPGPLPLTRLPGTDVWYRSETLPRGARFTYRLAPDPPGGSAGLQAVAQTDPLNPRTYGGVNDGDKYSLRSVVELPGAPTQVWAERRADAEAGRIEKLWFDDREIAIYTPVGYVSRGPAYDLLLVFDEEAYLDRVPTPVILDNLLAAKRIAPTVAILIGNSSAAGRARELPCNETFASYIAQKVVPWVREHYHVTRDASHVVIAGSSYGGLAAAYVAFKHPQIFGNVLSQSGSFWWSPPNEEPAWLIRQFAASPRLKLRFYLDAGTFEGGEGGGNLGTTRFLRDVLRAKGYTVEYREFIGGHDYLNWRGTLADGLMALRR